MVARLPDYLVHLLLRVGALAGRASGTFIEMTSCRSNLHVMPEPCAVSRWGGFVPCLGSC